ncbi:hypothetical protein, partial [Limnospira fusiformis]|uniref:hypothetical protein n=1 Tax=Limnospira fusiformis TaxID=54297 RepID=UPI0034E09283
PLLSMRKEKSCICYDNSIAQVLWVVMPVELSERGKTVGRFRPLVPTTAGEDQGSRNALS